MISGHWSCWVSVTPQFYVLLVPEEAQLSPVPSGLPGASMGLGNIDITSLCQQPGDCVLPWFFVIWQCDFWASHGNVLNFGLLIEKREILGLDWSSWRARKDWTHWHSPRPRKDWTQWHTSGDKSANWTKSRGKWQGGRVAEKTHTCYFSYRRGKLRPKAKRDALAEALGIINRRWVEWITMQPPQNSLR